MTVRGHVGDREQQRWHQCVNDSGETIPPFAAMAVLNTGEAANDQGHTGTVLRVSKPSPTLPLVFNGPVPIAAGEYGECTYDVPAAALLKAELAEAQYWYGPVSGQWYLSQKSLFRRFVEVAPVSTTDSNGNHVGVVVRSDARTLFEVASNLSEGGGAVAAYLLDEQGARTATTANLYPAPYETGSSLVGPFRGVAFAAESASSGFRGDVVEALYLNDQWIAAGSGRTSVSGTANGGAAAGDAVSFDVDTSDSRSITATGFALCGIESGDKIVGRWNGPEQRWDVTLACPSGSEEPSDPGDPDPGNPNEPVRGNAACYPCNGMPAGVDCDPRNCCPSDDPGLTVTTCEEFATAPDEYVVEVPPNVCVPNEVTGNSPDAVTGIVPGKVTLTHSATDIYGFENSCVWLSDVVTVGENDWQWELKPVKDGRSWLRLYKDGEPYLEYQTGEAWCPRCDNPVTVYCPPDECHDLTQKLCVKPVCTDDCDEGDTYLLRVGDADTDNVDSTTFDWGAAASNTAASLVDADFGCPDAPSRQVTLTYGSVSDEVDGVAIFDEFLDADDNPLVAFDPTTCEVDLDEICVAFMHVETQADDSDTGDGSPNRGINWGIGCKQGTDYFVATLGNSRVSEGCKQLRGQHLQSTDFAKITSTGIDPATNPDWTFATGSAFSFGVVAWMQDDAVTNDSITVVGHYDRVSITFSPYECSGGAGAYTCPSSAILTTCEAAGTDDVTITIENTGSTPFEIEDYVVSGAFGVCASPTITENAGGFRGVIGAGQTRTLTLTVDTSAAMECSGTVTITTNLAGAETCVVPVHITIVAAGSCTAGEACSSYFDDDFGDTIAEASGISLSAHTISPTNGGSLSWDGSVIQFTATASSAAQDGTSGPEWETDGSGLVVQPTTVLGLDEGNIQILTGAPANCIAKLATQVSYGGNVGEVYFHGIAFGVVDGKEWYAFGISGGSMLVLLKCTLAGIQTLESVSVGANTTGTLGVWLRNGVAHVAHHASQLAGVNALNDSSEVSYPPTLWECAGITGTKLGLILHNNSGYDQAGKYRGYNTTGPTELCITTTTGTKPPWEVAAP